MIYLILTKIKDKIDNIIFRAHDEQKKIFLNALTTWDGILGENLNMIDKLQFHNGNYEDLEEKQIK